MHFCNGYKFYIIIPNQGGEVHLPEKFQNSARLDINNHDHYFDCTPLTRGEEMTNAFTSEKVSGGKSNWTYFKFAFNTIACNFWKVTPERHIWATKARHLSIQQFRFKSSNNPSKKQSIYFFPFLEPFFFGKDSGSCPYFSQKLRDDLRKYH